MSEVIGLTGSPLARLAAEIRSAHEDVQNAAHYSAERAVEAGRLLAEAKARDDIPRGDWERWVKEEAGVPWSTARHYTSLFRAVEEQTLTLADIARAGQLGALRAANSRESRRRLKPEHDAADLPPDCTLEQRDVASLLECAPNSIDWIITDPPYPREYLPLYDHLARGAAHVLKPGGGLLCMTGQTYLPEVMAALAGHLQYHWTLAYLTPGGQAVQVFPRRVNSFWKPVLLFAKGELDCDWFGDVAKSDVNDNDKEHHDWGQSVSGMHDLMRRFVMPGQLVADPFLGGGTTAVVALDLNASFLGSDIDPIALATTRARLAHGKG